MNPEEFFDALALVPNMRTARFDDLEVVETEDGFRFEGLAGVYDEIADLGEITGVGHVTESIQRGAFRKVLAESRTNGGNIPLTLEHDRTKVLATTKSGTLKLEEVPQGLGVIADVPNTSLSRDVREMVKRRIIDGMSFGFVTGPRTNHKVERRSNGYHRTLLGFKELLDVCTTWDPTYRSAEAQFRSMSMRYADSPESLQQLFAGAYPQLGERAAITPDEATAETDDDPDQVEEVEGEGDETRVAEHRTSVAARKRALQFLILTTGGINDET